MMDEDVHGDLLEDLQVAVNVDRSLTGLLFVGSLLKCLYKQYSLVV